MTILKTVAVRPGWAVVPRKAADEITDSEAAKTETPLRSTTDSPRCRPKKIQTKKPQSGKGYKNYK